MTDYTNDTQPMETPADARMTILECPSCGSKHTDLAICEFTKPYGVYTHHFVCPTTGDPGFLSLHTHNGSPSEVDANICRCSLNAQQTGRWLAAFFSVADGKIRLDMVNNHMPHSDWLPAAQLLTQHMQQELGTDKTAPAAADTQRIQPLINLFGNEPDAPGDAETPAEEQAANETPSNGETPQAAAQDAQRDSQDHSRAMETPQVLDQITGSSQGNGTDKYPVVDPQQQLGAKLAEWTGQDDKHS